jgi:uncharacterized protein YkwD
VCIVRRVSSPRRAAAIFFQDGPRALSLWVALTAAAAGCQLPPAVWRSYQGLPPPAAELEAWLDNDLPAGTVVCPRAAVADSFAEAAHDRVNSYRRRMRLPCMTYVPEIATAAADHCAYQVQNRGACTANPHLEVESCPGFRAVGFAERMLRAGYDGHPAYETMAYVGDGARAVDLWVDSVWHRIPILSPWVHDMGYGGARGCDTVNFGWGSGEPPDGPVTYPFNGQIEVPTRFDGRAESPALPAPPAGWPSGYPIIIYAEGLEVTTHELLDDMMVPVPHVWITPDLPEARGILRREMVMYAYAPLKEATAYVVRIDGYRAGWPIHLEWTFATR